MDGEFHFTYQIGECKGFTQDGKKSAMSIVIAPLKVSDTGQEFKLQSGCNFWKACQNAGCQYSQLSYGGPKKF